MAVAWLCGIPMATKKSPKRRGIKKTSKRRTATQVRPRRTAPKKQSVASKAHAAFSHVEKVMFPEPGYTKGDLLAYYEAVAPLLIPHLRGRPLTLERVPDGVGGGGGDAPHFWQKNTPAYYP